MLVSHNTNPSNFLDILSSGKIHPASKTKIRGWSSGVISDKKYLPDVYLNTFPNDKKIIKKLRPFTFVFDSSVLLNKKICAYVAWAATKCKEYTIKKSKNEVDIALKYIYNRGIEEMEKNPRKLLKHYDNFVFYQEILLRGSIDIGFCNILTLPKNFDKKYKDIFLYIKNNYPFEIVFVKDKHMYSQQ